MARIKKKEVLLLVCNYRVIWGGEEFKNFSSIKFCVIFLLHRKR